MGRWRDPRRWRTVNGQVEHFCAGCKVWFARTHEHFHKCSGRSDGLQDLCRKCNIANVCLAHAKRRKQRQHALKRAEWLAATLPPLLALDAITRAWAER